MKKSSKLLSLLLSASLASQMISGVNINATKDSITFYDVKNNILDLKAYDAELDTNHDGNMNVFDVIRANKTLIQEESYTDLKEKVYMLETQIESLYQKLNEKTDAESGKQLSSNDYTDEEKQKLESLNNYDDTQIKSEVSELSGSLTSKVDREEGKQLSSNDYTDEEKQKLESLNNYDDTKINEKIDSLVQEAFDEKKKIETSIENKVDKEEGKQLSSNDYTDEEKQKLEGLKNYDDTKIKDEIYDIKANLDKLNNYNTYKFVPITDRYEKGFMNAITGVKTYNEGFRMLKQKYHGGDVYRVNSTLIGTSTVALCTIVDINGTVIETIEKGGSKSYVDEIIEIPSDIDEGFVYFNSAYGSGSYTLKVEKYDCNLNYISNYKDKYFSIMGDSISTFLNYSPSDYNCYYGKENNAGDVNVVQDTWWMKTINALGGKLGRCNAGGGSTVAGDGNYKMSSDARSIAGLGFTVEGAYTHPDVIIIEGGINDFTEYDLGTYDGTSDIPDYPQNTFREAYAIMLNKIRNEHPTSEIYCCTLFIGGNSTFDTFPVKNKYGKTLEEYNKAIREISSVFNAKVIEFAKCGITWYSNSEYTVNDGSGYEELHPNVKGMSMMANEAISIIDNRCNVRYNID